MIYLNAASSITHQPAFRNSGFSEALRPLHGESVLIHPDYKEFIEPVLLRRMSKLLRMGVACARDALQGLSPGAIIVGTGLGCLQDTEKFLSNLLTIKGLLPPTAFIQSTHNTIAGQISLSLGNHRYNMTHTQNTVSFEMALLDGILQIEEGVSPVLVGAADEHIPFLDEVAAAWGLEALQLTSGASFFVLSHEKSPHSLARLRDVTAVVGRSTDLTSEINRFLSANQLTTDDLDLVLYSLPPGTEWSCPVTKSIPYLEMSGVYPTAAAFALHYGADYLSAAAGRNYVLVVNGLNPRNLGLSLLQSLET